MGLLRYLAIFALLVRVVAGCGCIGVGVGPLDEAQIINFAHRIIPVILFRLTDFHNAR